MAEIVEQKLQEMIPEFEELGRLGFLTQDEIKKLIKKRRQFEYKICKRKKELQDFFEYVIYESYLLELIASRRQKVLQIKKFHKVENTISRRLMKKLHLMTCLWPAHQRVWKFRIAFAKARNLFEEVSGIFAEQIRFHGNDETVWVSWAQWEMEERRNFEKARHILLSRASLYHPKSILLTKEYFRLELLYIQSLKKNTKETRETLSKISKENKDKIMNCAIPEVIFKNSLEKFNSSELCQQFFWTAHEFSFAHRLRDKIIREMVNKFPNDFYLWNLKAQMLLKGFIVDETKFDTVEDVLVDSNEDGKVVEYVSKVISVISHTPKEKLTQLLNLYEETLSSIGTAAIDQVFNDLFKVLKETWASEEFRSLIIKNILNIFQTYSSELKPKHFCLWYEVASEEKYEESKLKDILEQGTKKYSDCQHLQLALLPFEAKKYKLKKKQNVIEKLSGKVGAEICYQLINDTKAKLQNKLIERACNHTDSTISKSLRVKLLENMKNITEARKHYEKYRIVPPLIESLHSTMLNKELQENLICEEKIRKIFDTCVEQFGDKRIGAWLSYIEFERKFGSEKNVSKLKEEAARKLNPKFINDFMENKIYLENSLKKVATQESEDFIVDSPELEEDGKHDFWVRSSLPNLLPQEPVITYEVEEKKNSFFRSLAQTEEKFSDLREPHKKEDNKIWEEILSLFLGRKIVLDTKKVSLNEVSLEKRIGKFIDTVEKTENSKNSGPSRSESILSKETKKILESSEILKPEFHSQKQIIPYYLSRHSVKRAKKKEKLKDKGKGWFNMKAPEITEELQRDLQILKMRSVLDPRTHYKRNVMKEVPKYFQVGKVVDSPIDFYSSRVPKKQRKRTLAEEIMNSEEVLRYQKRKCSELMKMKKAKTFSRKRARREKDDGMKDKKNKKKKEMEMRKVRVRKMY